MTARQADCGRRSSTLLVSCLCLRSNVVVLCTDRQGSLTLRAGDFLAQHTCAAMHICESQALDHMSQMIKQDLYLQELARHKLKTKASTNMIRSSISMRICTACYRYKGR